MNDNIDPRDFATVLFSSLGRDEAVRAAEYQVFKRSADPLSDLNSFVMWANILDAVAKMTIHASTRELSVNDMAWGKAMRAPSSFKMGESAVLYLAKADLITGAVIAAAMNDVDNSEAI